MAIQFKERFTYLVDSEEDQTVFLALNPRLGKGRVQWFDTVHDRIFRVQSVEAEGDVIKVLAEKASYTFRPLTLDLYHDRVQHSVTGRLDFSSTEELQHHYQRLIY